MQKRFRKIIRGGSAAVLSAALVLGTLAVQPTEVEAATKAKKLKVTPASKTLYIGGPASKKSVKLKVTITPKKASQKVTYKSSNKKVATVSSKGKVTAKKKGKATITVTSKSNKRLKKKIKITVKKYKKTTTTSTAAPTATVTPTGTPVVTTTAAPTATPMIEATDVKFANETTTLTMKGTGETGTLSVTLTPSNAAKESLTWTSSDESVASLDKSGNITMNAIGSATITATAKNGKTASCKVKVTKTDLAIHDPSVYRDPVSGKYYTFGSHLVAGVSSNLIGWSWLGDTQSGYTAKTGLFTKSYKEEFAEPYAFTMPKGANENAWAPDIVYNEKAKKYYMYISIVDGSKKCCIAMASSDKPDGPYAYQGMIVCSGLDTSGSDVDKTNVASALGLTAEQAKASKYATLGTNSPDCIDPTVFYDHSGNLWMVYGSFTTAGGLRMLKLNPDTGLRGTNYNESSDATTTTLGTDDPYYGRKICNNNGEGPYIQEVKDTTGTSSTGYYYYLWFSTGHLQSYGGYNMRLLRSETPDGEYKDPKGTLGTSTASSTELGLRIMDNYKFSNMSIGFTACGGNSATDDGNGKTFIQFHQKYAHTGQDFVTRTHQTFQNEDGWLVTAPYEYNGETIADSYNKSDVVGEYEFLYNRTTFSMTDYNVLNSVDIFLNENGTITGAYTGSWTLKNHYITIKIGDSTYKGVVLEQSEQTTDRTKVMVFTAAGEDNRTVWGSKVHKTDKEKAAYDVSLQSLESSATGDFTLPTDTLFGSEITWSSSNTDIIKIDETADVTTAKVTRPDKKTTVKLTATAKKGNETAKKIINVSVAAYEISLPGTIQTSTTLTLDKTTPQGTAITWTSSNEKVINKDTGAVTVPDGSVVEVILTATYGTIEKTFTIRVGKLTLESIYSQNYESATDLSNAGWTIHGQLTGLIDSSDDGNKFAKFTSTGSGPRSGLQTISVDNLTDTYVVSTDFSVTTATYSGSGSTTTQIALIGTGNTVSAIDNKLATDCIFDLQATVSAGGTATEKFAVNGDTSNMITIPAGTWCHMEATIDKTTKQIYVSITKKEDETEIYSGTSTFTADATIKGIFILNGRGGTVTQFDNTDVSVTTTSEG
jgi:arabinan endo-1,5-alpha-L-arabinosidase